jgi:hypothetical protein
MMHSTKGNNGSVGVGVRHHQGRNRNRYAVSAINSVIASSTGIQLPSSSANNTLSISDDQDGGAYPNGGGPFTLQTLEEEGVEMSAMGGGGNPIHFTDIDLNSEQHCQDDGEDKMQLKYAETET